MTVMTEMDEYGKKHLLHHLREAGWIRVDDELPEVNTPVKVHHPMYEDCRGELLSNRCWAIEDVGYAPAWRVTHWMPEPPREDKLEKT